MECPACNDSELNLLFTRQGVEVDQCPSCKGVWLDEGEIFHFTRYPKAIAKKLENAQELLKPGDLDSPMANVKMDKIIYDLEIGIEQCPETKGLWFSAGELKALLAREKRLKLEFDEKINKKFAPVFEKAKADRQPPEQTSSARIPLRPLPNLFAGSMFTLLGLYALLTLVLISAVEFGGMSPNFVLGFAIIFSFVQFVLSPWIMDLTLRWLYKMKFVEFDQLPEHSQKFVRSVCRKKNIAKPRFGIIDDGAPQAFTYGHVPGNARIILSAGLFELLSEDEVDSVIAHEIGHAVHWDMLVMTLAQLVPMVLYYIYKSMMNSKKDSGSSSKSGGNPAVAIGAYVLYIISEYIVLWLSRNREYHADRFSGEVTGDPSYLASALVKIAYGLAGGDHTKDEEEARERKEGFDAIGALGIFNSNAARSLAIAGYDEDETTLLNKESVRHAMRWDMWNPWAKYYELHSTHPLVAKRLLALSNQSKHMHLPEFIEFDEEAPESYWDEFFTDVVIMVLPTVCLMIGIGMTALSFLLGEKNIYLSWPLILCGIGILVKAQFIYRNDFFPRTAISGLLKKVKVSAVRPVPCKIKGKVIGRGIPGYLFSEDFVIKDKTGIMFLDYRQPLAIWEFFFSILRRGNYDDQEVEVHGWYRRAPMPYVEVRELVTARGDKIKSWVPTLYRLSGVALIFIGGFFL